MEYELARRHRSPIVRWVEYVHDTSGIEYGGMCVQRGATGTGYDMCKEYILIMLRHSQRHDPHL